MTTRNSQFPQIPNHYSNHNSQLYRITADNNMRNQHNTSHYRNQKNTFKVLNQNGSVTLNNSNIENMNGWSSVHVSKQLNVKTTFSDDDVSSLHTSTVLSNPPTSPPIFHLVRNSSFHGPRVEAPNVNELKVDVYNIGVVMKSSITGSFDPDLFKVEAVAPTGRIIRITGDGQYMAQFNQDEIGRWNVAMYYDGKYLDGCPVDVCDPSQVKVRDLKGGLVGRSIQFHVDCTKAGPGELGVDITNKGKPVSVFISQTASPGYKKVSFTPYEPGPYEINVHFNKAEVREGDVEFFNPDERQRRALFFTTLEPHQGHIDVKATCDWEVDYITGWPFICHVSDTSDIFVYGMEDGSICSYPTLIADCTHVGDGRIMAEVTYNHYRYPCKIERTKPGTYNVRFKPKGPGVYKVWIDFEGRPVKGSPFIQEIAELEKPQAQGDGLYRGVLGNPTVFTVDTKGHPGQVSVTVNGPTRNANCQLEPQQNNMIRATYHPKERGPHTVHIRVDGKDINGSPYVALIVDPVSVRVAGDWRSHLDEKGIIPLRVNKEKHFTFDVSGAGPGELTSEVQGPNGKIPVTIDARNDGHHSIVFMPREEGKHDIYVKWGGFPLSDSPYLGYATYEPELEEPYNVRLVHVPGQNLERYPPSISSVYSSTVDSSYIINRDVEPEPVQQTVVINNLTESLPRVEETVYRQSYKNAYFPEKPQTRVQVLPVYMDNSNEPSFVEYYPPNTDQIFLPTNAQPPSSSGPQKVTLNGKGLKEAKVNKRARFTVDGSQADPGQPTAYLQGNDDQVPVTTDQVRPQVYKCSYVPTKPGPYLLNIDWNDKPLKGSPFKVNVNEPDQSQNLAPTRTVSTTQNEYPKPMRTASTTQTESPLLTRAAITPQIDYLSPTRIPNTTKASPRLFRSFKDVKIPRDSINGRPDYLDIRCEDPKGKSVPYQLKDNPDGMKSIKIRPRISGTHMMTIRRNGDHIKGSPFEIDIRENQVKEHVRVWGPGIENGIMPNFQSNFWVDTTGANAGEMRVRVVGPKGAFHVKLKKDDPQDKIYQCFYNPVEPGIYTIFVQLAGVHIGGSPFTVLLADSTQGLQEMQDELQESSGYNGDDASLIAQRYSKKYPWRQVSTDDVILY